MQACQQKPSEQPTEVTLGEQAIITFKKVEDGEINMMTDQNGPWKSVPESIKAFFQHTQKRRFNIKDITHDFEKKYGMNNICTKFFPSGGEYYTCQDCCKNGGGTIMCFCLPCWEPEKHIGHNFDKRTAWSSSAYCDCGWDDRIKPESFCKNHGSKQILSLQIPDKERQKFIQFFEPLIHIGIYLGVNSHDNNLHSKLWDKITPILIELLESSLFYIRIFDEIIQKEVIVNDNKFTLLEALLRERYDHELLLFRLCGDKKTKLMLAKVLVKMMNDGWSDSNYSTLIKDCFTETSILMQLAQNDIFISKYENKYLDMVKTHPKKGQDIIYKYHLHQKQRKDKNAFLEFMTEYWKKDSRFEPKKPQLIKLIFSTLFQSFSDDKNEVNNKKQDNDLSLRRSSVISRFIFLISDKDIEKMINFQEKLLDLGISEENFDKFMESAMIHSKKIIYKFETSENYRIMPIMFLLINHKKQEQLVERLWESLTMENDGLREDFIETVDVVYHLIALINSYKVHLYGDVKQENDEAKEKWFRSYLYETHRIDKDTLQRMRTQQNHLKFKTAGKILKELCKYRESQNVFEYVSQQKFPNFQMKYKVRDKGDRGNFRSVPHGNISIEDNIDIPEDFEGRKIINVIFRHKNFTGAYCRKWWQKVKDFQNDSSRTNFWKNYELSFHYCLVLVSAKLLMSVQNPLLNEEINKIRDDKDLFTKMNSYNGSPNLLINLLPEKKKLEESPKKEEMNENEEMTESNETPVKQSSDKKIEIQSPEKSAENSERKEKFNKKKMEKYAKLKEKRGNVLSAQGKKTSVLEENEEDEHDECLLCHEKAGKNQDKEMMYLGSLQKDGVLSTSFHGKQNKCDLMFNSCFHALHTKCYLGIDKRQLQFSCPLCSKKSNIVFPCKTTNIDFIKKCQNIINALYVVKYKDLSFPTLIQLCFKHLVQSLGLNSLIYLPRHELEKKKNYRLNDHMFKVMKAIYEQYAVNGSNPLFNKIIDRLNTSLQSCENILAKNVQLLISRAIQSKIKNRVGEYDEKLIMEIQKELDPEEFLVLVENLESLLEEKLPIEIPEVDKEKKYKKLSFTVVNIPPIASDLDTFYDLPCNKCGKKRELVCLITGKVYCLQQGCTGFKQHLQGYQGNLLAIKIGSGKINIYKKNSKNHEDVYYDPFIIPYSNKEKAYKDEIFEIDMPKFIKITNKFFGIK